MATVAAALVVAVVVIGPALVPTSGPSPERLAQPDPSSSASPLMKGPPPALGSSFRVLLDGEPLPGNEWEVAAGGVGGARTLTVEVRRTGAAEVCLLSFAVLPQTGGAPVGRGLTQGPGQGTDPEVFTLSWDATTPDGDLVPPGRYRLVARTQEQDRPCGVVGDDGPRADVETSLGYFTVGAGT